MAFKWQRIDLPIIKGLNQKQDPLQLQADLSTAENCRFDKIGRISKREGYTIKNNISIELSDTQEVNDIHTLVSNDNALVSLTQVANASGGFGIDDGWGLFAWSDRTDYFKKLNSNQPITISQEKLAAASMQFGYTDSSLSKEAYISTAYDKTTNVLASVTSGNGTQPISSTKVFFRDLDSDVVTELYWDIAGFPPDGSKSSIFSMDGSFVLLVPRPSSNSILIYDIEFDSDLNRWVLARAGTTLTSDYNGTFDVYDACVFVDSGGDKALAIAYNKQGVSQHEIKSYSPGGTTNWTHTVTYSIISISLAIAPYSDPESGTAETQLLFTFFDGGGIQLLNLDATTNSTLSTATPYSSPYNTYGICSMSVIRSPYVSDECYVSVGWYDAVATSSNDTNLIEWLHVDTGTGTFSQLCTQYHTKQHSKPFFLNNKVAYTGIHQSVTQPHGFIFILDDCRDIDTGAGYAYNSETQSITVGKFAHNRGWWGVSYGSVALNFRPADVSIVGEDTIYTGVFAQAFLEDQEPNTPGYSENDDFLVLYPTLLTISNQDTPFPSLSQKTTLLSAGYLSEYDGLFARENNFFVGPEIADEITESSAGSPSAFAAGEVYSYIAVYEAVNAQGDLIQSKTSPAISHTIANTYANGLTINVRPYSFGHFWHGERLNQDTWGSIYVKLYRTTDGGTTYYYIGEKEHNTWNESRNTSIREGWATFTDITPDDNLTDNALLYTTGGEVPNVHPPLLKYIEEHNGRIVGVSAEKEDELWATKTQRPGYTPRFTDLHRVRVPQVRAIKQLASMDGILYLFTEDKIYYLNGDFVNDFGTSSTLQPAQLISNNIGIRDPNSLIKTNLGLFFMSKGGIYRLARNRSLEYIGAGIQDFQSQIIIQTYEVSTKDQIRFLTESGNQLVFDTVTNQWSVYTNYDTANCVAILNNTPYYGLSSGVLAIEGGYKDYYPDGASVDYDDIDVKVAVGWLQFSGIQGWQSIRRIHLLGLFKSNHTYNVKLYYDHEDTAGDTLSIDTSSLGYSADDVYELILQPSRQRCRALKIEIYDSDQDGTLESFTLSSIALEVGYTGRNLSVPGLNKALS